MFSDQLVIPIPTLKRLLILDKKQPTKLFVSNLKGFKTCKHKVKQYFLRAEKQGKKCIYLKCKKEMYIFLNHIVFINFLLLFLLSISGCFHCRHFFCYANHNKYSQYPRSCKKSFASLQHCILSLAFQSTYQILL